MTTLREDVEETARRLALKIQGEVSANSAEAAYHWAEALRDTCAGLRDLIEAENDDT